ncbi:General receptor for phosphoinositides 1-associated scaffold protein [Mizuhopecten yessoensis]|uniref:General receptor for phosphoinositides 1-associated scaffold protein n=1 Tax=Mizuhopecten yessoensis TaxID=6573 RepID=A0A210PH94_MIZYE|nr:General receptor for phosphoinositides 1-associated scaffold protein [Mizuhopecten yessoensis]
MLHQTSSLGADLNQLDAERSILSEPEDNRKRRTLLLHKNNQSWGFTLQTYGIKNKKTNEVEVMTYVDYIDLNSSAYIAGLRTGDVILSVNGRSMEEATHADLVSAIKLSGDQLRLVVLFEDCVHKVELYDRIIRLKRVVTSKMKELRDLEFQEREILDSKFKKLSRGISRYDNIRQSVYSTASSSSWDRYSVLSSQNISNFPKAQQSLPKILISGDRFSDNVLVYGEEDTGSLLSETLCLADSYCDTSYADSESDSVSGLRFTCDGHSVNSDSLGSVRNGVRSQENGPTGTIRPADGNIGALYEDQAHEDFDDLSMDRFGPIDITFNPLLRHDIRKIKSEGHMETLEWKSSRKSEQNLKHTNKLKLPNVTGCARESKQLLEEQRCGSFRSLQEHGWHEGDRSEVNSSRSEVRHKQLSLNSLEKISTRQTDQSTLGTTASITPQKRQMSGDVFPSENFDHSIKIPFLHSGPVHINERSEVTKL